MKYIIDIPDEKTYAYINDEKTFLRMPISLGENEIKSMFAPTMLRIKPYIEPDRKAIEDEVWEFAKKVSIMKPEDKRECWGTDKYNTINFGYSYQEAKARYEEWRKQKEEVRVGDEVELVGGSRCIVWGIESGIAGLLFKDGGSAPYPIDKLIKTGRHFDEVDELLERMKAE